MSQPTYGYLSETSSRYDDWIRVFGTNRVELESAIPISATLPGRFGRVLVYKLKMSSISEQTTDRLIAWMAQKFGRPIADVEADVRGEHGVPILAEDVHVTFDTRLVL